MEATPLAKSIGVGRRSRFVLPIVEQSHNHCGSTVPGGTKSSCASDPYQRGSTSHFGNAVPAQVLAGKSGVREGAHLAHRVTP